MGNLLDIVKREIDPRHDFDRVGYFEKGERSLDILENNFKHYIRGVTIGAGLGALGYCIAGKDPKQGALVCGIIGLSVDSIQYLTRGLIIPRTKMMCKDIRGCYLFIRNRRKKSSDSETSF